MMIDQQLQQLIQETQFLNGGDKSFLLEKLANIEALDKMRLRTSLLSNQPTAVLQSLQMIRAKFFVQATQKPNNPIENIISGILPQKKPEIVAFSVLTKTDILGSLIPTAAKDHNVPMLKNLQDFQHPFQLSMLTNEHVNFHLNSNIEQIVQAFMNKSEKVFESIEDINTKRGYFMNYIQSPLFANYLNTALTGIKHIELQPRNVALNLLYQINTNYLNNKQFEITANITNHLRGIIGL
jgi:hypothetical protein